MTKAIIIQCLSAIKKCLCLSINIVYRNVADAALPNNLDKHSLSAINITCLSCSADKHLVFFARKQCLSPIN